MAYFLLLLLLCTATAHHSVATTVLDNNNNNLDRRLTYGSQETVSLLSSDFAPPPPSPPPPSSGTGGDSSISFFFPSSGGNITPKEVNNDDDQGNNEQVALDLQTNNNNGNRGREEEPKFLLSEGKGCRPTDGFNQAPHEHRRRMRREEGKACLSDYPIINSPGNDWNQPSSKKPSTSTPSKDSQDTTTTTGEAGAEGQALDKEPAISQSVPAADPSWCPYPDHPIPACGSYIWARNAISPYTLPSCTPINPLLDPPCISPMFLFCCQLVESVRITVLETKVAWRLSGSAWGLSAKNCILPGASQNWLDDVRLPPPGYSGNGF